MRITAIGEWCAYTIMIIIPAVRQKVGQVLYTVTIVSEMAFPLSMTH